MPMTCPPFLDAAEIARVERWIACDAQGTPARIPAGARVRLHGTLDAEGRLDAGGGVVTERLRRR